MQVERCRQAPNNVGQAGANPTTRLKPRQPSPTQWFIGASIGINVVYSEARERGKNLNSNDGAFIAKEYFGAFSSNEFERRVARSSFESIAV